MIVRHMVLWIAFIGAGLAAREGKHIRIDIAYRILPDGMKRFAEVVTSLFTTVMCGILLYASIIFIQVDYSTGTSILFYNVHLPVWTLEVVIPIEDMSTIGQVQVELTPGPATAALTERRTSIWPSIYPEILQRILANRTTIIFCNARRAAERLAAKLNELAIEQGVPGIVDPVTGQPQITGRYLGQSQGRDALKTTEALFLTRDPRGTRHVVVGTACDESTPVAVVVRFVEREQLLIITVYELK